MRVQIRILFAFSIGFLLLVPPSARNRCSAQEAHPQISALPPVGSSNEAVQGTDSSAEELPIGTGDLLELSMYGSEDFHETVRVSNSKIVTLPLIGAVEVVGLSPKASAELIRKKLIDGNFYTDPQISVFVKEYAAEGVYVLGEVQKPGCYPILNAHDVMQAISLAGGTTQKAGRVVTIRNPKRPATITVNIASMQSGKPEAMASADVALMPGDTVIVSKAGIVYVIGDVHLPSGIILESANLTVLQAIALAQGTNPTAALSDAKLIRRGPDGPTEETFSLKKIMAAKAPDIKVQADDIIFVPVSSAKAISRRGLEAILQAATGVAMYSHF